MQSYRVKKDVLFMIFSPLMDWFVRYGKQLYVGVCFLLVAVLSFEAGYLMQAVKSEQPLIIRVPEATPEAKGVEKTSARDQSNVTNSVSGDETADRSRKLKECAFVGSKKSNKYHLPSSRCAKQINPENLICFSSIDNALSKGYQPGCLE